jgi:diguanylate cyclase (GGDEF)-like protein/PAS domain S-box-containing protein
VAVTLLLDFGHATGSLAMATLFTAVAILVLGVIVLVRARATLITYLFFAITVGASGWLGFFALMYGAASAGQATAFARVASAFASILPAATFHFAAAYVNRRRALRNGILFCWVFCCAIALLELTTPYIITGVRHFDWGYYPIGWPYNFSWVSVFVGMFAAAVSLLWRAAKTSEGMERKRARALVVSFAVAFLACVEFLPTLGIDVMPLGFIAILAFIAIAAHAIWRYRLVELTQEYAAGQILATMKGAVIVVDLDGKIRVANRAASMMLGYPDSALLGKHIRSIVSPEENLTTGQLLNSLGTLEQNMAWCTAAGARIDVLATSSFVRDDSNNPVGIVYAATDITERRRVEQALREGEHRYRTLFEGNPLPMWVYDYETLAFIAVNEAAVNHYGFSKDEFLRMTIENIRPPEDLDQLRSALRSLRDRNEPRLFRHRKRNGHVFEAEVISFEFLSAGRRSRLVIAVDVTERRGAEQRLRASEERYRLLFERNLAGVYRSTIDGLILDGNDAIARMFGYRDRDEFLAQTAYALYYSKEDRNRLMAQVREYSALSNVEVRMRRRDGTPVWVIENMTLLDGGVLEGTIVDITDRKTAQEQMEYQAYHDALTGLPNRLLFRDRIEIALAHSKRHRTAAAVMFLDLDQFKLVNDSLGHTVGDELLQEVATRLVLSIRADDTVARMGGDEFTVLLTDIKETGSSAIVAQKLLDAISQPMVIDGHELYVTTSIGIARFPEDGIDAETLLKRSDGAMYRAKEAGRNNFQFATSTSMETTSERLLIEQALHHAFEREEFVVHYQPMTNLLTGNVVGAEALIRWNHPERGLMPPDDFIHIAEECGLILPIGEWVLRTAVKQMKGWHAEHGPLRVAVNLSARQFQQRDLTTMIERILTDNDYPAELLDVEITESTAMQNADISLAVMKRLRQMGVRISIDDFGTGYSSLSYLKRFPIDTVKIDQNFVRDLSDVSNDGAIITAVISMARALNLRVVAEGVETEAQLAFLRKENCEVVQGFLHSRPVSAAEFESSLRARRA